MADRYFIKIETNREDGEGLDITISPELSERALLRIMNKAHNLIRKSSKSREIEEAK